MTWHPTFQPKVILKSNLIALWWCSSIQSMATFSKTPFCSSGILGIQPEPSSFTHCWGKQSTWRPPKLESFSPTSLTSDGKHIIKKKKKRRRRRNSRIWPFLLFNEYSSLEFGWNSVRDPYGLLWLQFNFLSICKLILHGDNDSYLGFGGRHI